MLRMLQKPIVYSGRGFQAKNRKFPSGTITGRELFVFTSWHDKNPASLGGIAGFNFHIYGIWISLILVRTYTANLK